MQFSEIIAVKYAESPQGERGTPDIIKGGSDRKGYRFQASVI